MLSLPYNDQIQLNADHKHARQGAVPEHITLEVDYLAASEQSDADEDQSDDKLQSSILIIEDNADMRDFLASSFTRKYRCLTAKDGEQGIALAQEFMPDLIICDVMMPGIDGFEVALELKRKDQTSHIPIIMLTAKGDLQSRMQGWQQNVDDYIAKPFHPGELSLRVSNLLSIRKLLKKRFGAQLSQDSPLISFQNSGICAKDQAFIEQFEGIISAHYQSTGFSRSKAASLMALGERQLNRKLAALVDHNFSEYLRKYRLRQAIGLLGKGLQIAQIADNIGFSSTTYFNTCFKAEFGKSAKQYEREHGYCQ